MSERIEPAFSQSLSASMHFNETTSVVKSWLKDCTDNRQLCGRSSTTQGWYPTRLLDCGPLGNSESYFRLVVTTESTISGPYMSLSHCWGGANCLKARVSKLDQMLKRIPFSSSLPGCSEHHSARRYSELVCLSIVHHTARASAG